VIVTGVGGFIGSAAATHMAQSGHEVFGIGRSPLYDSLPGLLQEYHLMNLPDERFRALVSIVQPDAVVHAAGPSQVRWSVAHPLEDFSDSVALSAYVLDTIRQTGAHSRVILLSSAAVYGNVGEIYAAEAEKRNPVSPYGWHKRMCEELAEYHARSYGLRVCSLRIFSAYGPGLRRQVMWDICRRARGGGAVELMGTGDETRDFIEVTDIIQAVERVLSGGDFDAGIYNVATGRATAVRDLAAILIGALGTNNRVIFDTFSPRGDPPHYRADIGKLRSIGFTPSVNLEAGVAKYVKWIMSSSQTRETALP
jgi:UDP-glucose 4-epimerase